MKQLFKKWWFWLILVIIIFVIWFVYMTLTSGRIGSEEKDCPETLNCMPSPDPVLGAGEYCIWVQENCPDTEIAY